MKEYIPTGNLLCYWGNLKEHPKCCHGSTLLFGRETNGEVTKFYVCSACRDRKLCLFYAEYGKELSKQQKQIFENERKKNLLAYQHQKLFIHYNQLISENPAKRAYCHTCEKLFLISEIQKHDKHDITDNVSDYHMTHPSELLKPLENSKKEAQYLFSKKAVTDIINILIELNAKNVLCIGTPRIHEYITQNLESKMSSLLLDFDGRFHNFYGPLNYCWYNLFNHHFFQENSENVFKEFLKQNRGKDMYLICDPPFGGRVEPISQTIKTINDLHKKVNKITDNENELKIFFIFPYFMEALMKKKSNPPNVSGGLKDLKMTDYKVEYDNHPLFVSKVNNEQQGSQVRIFTNVSLNLIKLPESDGYKYCKRCQRWVAPENKHCKICKSCTSKDGRRYRHCKLCERCIKPTWQHCKTCNRCLLPSHKCGQKLKVGRCYKCNEIGHTEKECQSEKLTKTSKARKRKNDVKNNTPIKKQKLEFSKSDTEKYKESKLLKTKNKKLNIEKRDNVTVKTVTSVTKQNKKKEKISKTLKSSIVNTDIKNTIKKARVRTDNAASKEAKAILLQSKKKKKVKDLVTSTKNFDDLKENSKRGKAIKKKNILKN